MTRYARVQAPPLRPCERLAWGGEQCVALGGHYPELTPASVGLAGGGRGEGSGREEGREGRGGETRRAE